MPEFNIKNMLDPVKTAREEGRLTGRKEMRDQIRQAFSVHATTHHDSQIRAELWTFLDHIDRMSPS
jgi:hypothetical protein